MIAEARRRASERQLAITFEVGQVQALPFSDAGQALSEMVRVTRKGGRVVVFDLDWDTLIIDHPDKETTRTIVRSFSDSVQNGWIGRQLPRLFKEQHLEVLSLDPVQIFLHYALTELAFGGHLAQLQACGTLTPGQAQQWWGVLATRRQGRDVAGQLHRVHHRRRLPTRGFRILGGLTAGPCSPPWRVEPPVAGSGRLSPTSCSIRLWRWRGSSRRLTRSAAGDWTLDLVWAELPCVVRQAQFSSAVHRLRIASKTGWIR
jgi:hypothetical protein